MREIKFRAWDKRGKRWIHHEESGLLFLNFETTGGGIFHLHDELSPTGEDYYEIMQYTGLKDKNGVDIYESDIVVAITDQQFAFVGRKVVGEVRWDEEDTGYFLLTNTDKYPHLKFYHCHEFKVISNIYENPELLES